MIKWVVEALLSPLTKLGEKYLDNQKDRERLEHGTARVVYEADAAFRIGKLSHLVLRLPIFVAEGAAALFFAAILIDSTFPSDYLNPLELPEWFKPQFSVALASIFGISTFERVINRRR